MSKRKLNSRYNRTGNSSDSESNYSDSDSYANMSVVKRRKYNNVLQGIAGKNRPQMNLPREENEHTYSSTPIFNNMASKELDIGSSSESDYNKYVPSESLKSCSSGKNKFSSKRKPKCNSKNAVMARMNRQRKKEYVENLEGDIKRLKEINNYMKIELLEQKELANKLKNEILYLRSALSNNKHIGGLLRKITGNSGNLKLTSSLLNTPPPSEPEAEANLSFFGYEGTAHIGANNIVSTPSEPEAENLTSSNFEEGQSAVNEISLPLSEPETELNLTECGLEEEKNILDWLASHQSVEKHLVGPQDPLLTDSANVELDDLFGVCLHVSKKHISLEFCESCRLNSSRGILNEEGLPMVK